jgi:hypothetical protein
MPSVNVFQTKGLVVQNNMIFRDVDVYGGGALYIGVNYLGSVIEINGNFTNNKVMFVFKNATFAGSEHGEGGAIKLDWVEGNPIIRGYFANNYAPDGAAIQIMVCARPVVPSAASRALGSSVFTFRRACPLFQCLIAGDPYKIYLHGCVKDSNGNGHWFYGCFVSWSL